MSKREDRLKAIYPKILADIQEYDLKVREIALKYHTSTGFIKRVAEENGVDMKERQRHMRSLHNPPKKKAYRFVAKYKETWIQESMTGDGVSLEWLRKKWNVVDTTVGE